VGVLSESGLIARPLGVLPLINVAAPSYLGRHGIPETPDDLDRHLVVRYASPSTGRIEDWEWIDNGHVRTRAVGGRITVNSAEAYIACALAGLGMIQIPAYDVRPHLAAGELAEILPRHRAQPLPMTFLYPSRQHRSRRIQVFADWLENLLRDRVLL
jgi:DNA-binding transcriptional LysR family regulator